MRAAKTITMASKSSSLCKSFVLLDKTEQLRPCAHCYIVPGGGRRTSFQRARRRPGARPKHRRRRLARWRPRGRAQCRRDAAQEEKPEVALRRPHHSLAPDAAGDAARLRYLQQLQQLLVRRRRASPGGGVGVRGLGGKLRRLRKRCQLV